MIEGLDTPVKAALRITCLLLGGALLALLLLTLLHAALGLAPVVACDSAVQTRLHDLARPWLTLVMLACTWIGAIRIFLVAALTVVVGLWLSGRRHAGTVLIAALTGALLLNQGLKLHFHRARPAVPWSIGDEPTFSFPSGHALFSTVLYATLAYLALPHARSLGRRIAIMLPALLLPVAIGVSRIYLGMHFPSDVLAGYLCGGIWAASIMAADRCWLRATGRETSPPRLGHTPPGRLR